MRVLGIETSCDETGVAIYDSEIHGTGGLVSNLLYSQVELHQEFGGVVPELASRDHIRKTLPMIDEALREAGLESGDIDGIAYTAGPGLVGALMVGASIAKSLALAWDVPAIRIHHMEGHLLAPLLADKPGDEKPEFPFLALLVSGGHTQLMSCESLGQYEILGESLDDAAGEAFDKVAKMLGLGYPGGPEIARIAEAGDPGRFHFPRPMTDRPGLDFSFSGLKTFTMNTLRDMDEVTDQDKSDIAVAFQDAVVDTMRIKCRRAFEQTGLDTMVIAGGVSANRELRRVLAKLANDIGVRILYPALSLCTDNGAMIAYAGYEHFRKGHTEDLSITVRPRWPMTELGESNHG